MCVFRADWTDILLDGEILSMHGTGLKYMDPLPLPPNAAMQAYVLFHHFSQPAPVSSRFIIGGPRFQFRVAYNHEGFTTRSRATSEDRSACKQGLHNKASLRQTHSAIRPRLLMRLACPLTTSPHRCALIVDPFCSGAADRLRCLTNNLFGGG